MNQTQMKVADEEQVARLVSQEWVVDGVLQVAAFVQAPRETYLSVNRLSIDSYSEDVRQFVKAHPKYYNATDKSYMRALLDVAGIRTISIEVDELKVDANVEVEPRDVHTQSHAGIFVRVKGRNVVPGRQLPNGHLPFNVSEEMLLQRVQWELHDLAELQRQTLL